MISTALLLGHLGQLAAARLHLVLDVGDRLLGLGLVAVHDLPPRALRQVPADEDDHQAQDRTEEERDAPADARLELVEEDEGAQRADDGPGPVGAVDHEVDAAPEAGGDQLVDRGVDGRVLAADAHAGDEPGRVQEGQRTEPVADRQRGQAAADQVDGQGDDEQLPAAEPVREAAEEQRPEDLTGQVDRRHQPDLSRAQTERVLAGELGGGGTGDGDLETVEDPGHPEGDDHPGVERGPGQPVDPRGDEAAYGSRAGGRRLVGGRH